MPLADSSVAAEVEEVRRHPRVSAIVPAFSASGHIRAALESIFAQTLDDHEVIVVNDGSPDTDELEAQLGPYRSRITYVMQPNGGPGAARNAGIRIARGSYVAFLDADDVWHPTFLAEQMAFFRAHAGVDMAYTDGDLRGDGRSKECSYMQVLPSVGAVTLRSLLLRHCTVLTSAVVARRAALMEVGLFDARFRLAEDYDLWLRLAHSGMGLGYQRKVLITRNARPESLAADEVALLKGVLAVYSKLSEMQLSSGDLAALREATRKTQGTLALFLAKQDLARGDFGAAVSGVRKANEVFRRWKLRLALCGLEVTPELVRWYHRRRLRSDEISGIEARAGDGGHRSALSEERAS